MTARILAIVAGALILAAVAHVTVIHTGGYGTAQAALTLAVAFGVACGSIFCGMAWTKGAHILAAAFSICIVCGEAYNFFQSANRLMAATEAAQAPKREHAKAFAKARDDVSAAEAAVRGSGTSQRLADAIKAKKVADKAVTNKSAERGCAANCRQLLQAAVDSAAEEITKARVAIEAGQQKAEGILRTAQAALAGMTAPESATPFADRIGMAPWAFDVLVVALGSIAINGLACCLMVFGTHQPRAEPPQAAAAEPAASEPTPPTYASRERSIAGIPMTPPAKPAAVGNVSEFMLACLKRAKGSDAAVPAIYARYRRWCDEQTPTLGALDAPAFADQFKVACGRRIAIELRGTRAYCLDVQLAA